MGPEGSSSRRRCLVMLPPGLGWLIRMLPVVAALTHSARRLTLNVDAAVVPLLELSGIDPRPWSWREEAAQVDPTPFDEAFLLGDGFADAWWARSHKIPRRWGYRGGWRSWLLAPAVKRPKDPARPVDDFFRELLDAAGVDLSPRQGPAITPSAELLGKGLRRLQRAHLSPDDRPLVGLYAGTQGGASGRPWPRQDFADLLRQLRRRHPGWRFVLLATVRDLWTAVRLFEDTGKIHPVIGPDLDYPGLAGLLGNLDAIIAADSWLLQLAAACGLESVGLFARQRRSWVPQGVGHHGVVSRGSSLAPITVDEVVDACEALCREAPGPPRGDTLSEPG